MEFHVITPKGSSELIMRVQNGQVQIVPPASTAPARPVPLPAAA